MKAYRAWDARSVEPCDTVVFANSVREAKRTALNTGCCENADWIDIRVKRLPAMDGMDRGRSEANWYDPEDRRAMVALGWCCYDPDPETECPGCPARDICEYWQDRQDWKERNGANGNVDG